MKILNGINLRNAFDSTLFEPLLNKLLEIHKTLKYKECIKLIKTLVEVPPYFLNKENILKEEEEE